MWASGRLLIYSAGLLAGGAALMGYADFDPETWMLDIKPFKLDEFMLTAGTTAGNALAVLAVWSGWRGRAK